MSSSLARLVRSLRLSRRQLALPPLRPSQMVTPEQLAQLDADHGSRRPARSHGRSSCGSPPRAISSRNGSGSGVGPDPRSLADALRRGWAVADAAFSTPGPLPGWDTF